MHHLTRLKRLTIATCLSAFLLMISQQSMASEIKAYLNKDHADQIIGITEAKSIGYSINFIYLDRLTELEDQVSQRVTGDYQQSIDKIVEKEGLEKLMAMDDVERTEFFMRRFTQLKERPISPKSVLPSELSDIKHAIAEIIEAEEQGITEEQLPVILLKGQLFQQTYDLLKVIKND